MDAKTLCLGVLAKGDASGYEIKKAFEEGPFAHIHPTSFGSIYPALAKLTDEGLVSCTELAQDKRPDKKVYAMTESGRRALVTELGPRPFGLSVHPVPRPSAAPGLYRQADRPADRLVRRVD
jgi:DNA-binding PadR family transcriptional regulator